MDFTSDDLRRVAQLARLALTDDEQRLFARQVSEFLAYARQVQDLDTRGIDPSPHPAGSSGPLREDRIGASLPRDTVLGQAPDADLAAGLFKVPRVLG